GISRTGNIAFWEENGLYGSEFEQRHIVLQDLRIISQGQSLLGPGPANGVQLVGRGNVIERCTVNGNVGKGIISGPESLVTDSVVTENTGGGIAVESST